jgi:hypothetical protein
MRAQVSDGLPHPVEGLPADEAAHRRALRAAYMRRWRAQERELSRLSVLEREHRLASLGLPHLSIRLRDNQE